MESYSVAIRPFDSRCRYWAKIVRAGEPIPLPCDAQCAGDIDGPYLRRGEEELLPGDVLFEGEANHHRRQRGWSYWLKVVTTDGDLLEFGPNLSPYKAELKSQGLPPELLRGAGDIAAMVRIVHGIRAGLTLSPEED